LKSKLFENSTVKQGSGEIRKPKSENRRKSENEGRSSNKRPLLMLAHFRNSFGLRFSKFGFRFSPIFPFELSRATRNFWGMFRPCIDLHQGKVKQLVGGTLGSDETGLQTNFVSARPAAWYAELYRDDGLSGGHVVMLGPGNDSEALAALAAYPGGLQVGGGINLENASGWLDAGASHVIVTSWVFRDGRLDQDRLEALVQRIGRERLVLDLSCRRRGEDHVVVTDRWQRFTELKVTRETLDWLGDWCAEFLIHAVDVEGLCRGIDHELVAQLAADSPVPVTYAGGANSLADLEEVTRVGQGRIDLTIGSALDIFGGTGVRYRQLVEFNRRHPRKPRDTPPAGL
jgi:phosphoribosylformimino-5-aminoimidazole carboxamide ribotide isomerase